MKGIDEDAFITQSNVNGVYGKGFDKIKIKEARKRASEKREADAKAAAADSPVSDTAL